MEQMVFKAAFAVDDSGAVEGTAWPFGSPDRTGDTIVPEAFASAVGHTLPMMTRHSESVGVWDSITVDAEGLKVKGRLLIDDVPDARITRALVREGAMTGLSVGFIPKKAIRSKSGRTFTDLELVEVSIVAVPAHAGARVTNIKELPMGEAATENKEFEAELKAANDSIEALTKRLDEAETKLNRPAVQTKSDDEPSEERKAFTTYLRRGDKASEEELKALVVANDEQAGYLAPPEMATEFIRDLVEFSPIRSVASVRSIGAMSVKYPRRTGITNANWEGETEESEESNVTFGQVEIPANRISTYVDISNELLSDSAGSAEQEVRLALSEDFAQKEGLAFVEGSGVKQPEGLLTNAEIEAYLNGHATTLSADKLITMMYDMPATYRNNGSWLMNGTTLGVVRTLKDTNGAYIWQPGLQAGQPSTLLGRPVVEAVDMPNVASGEFPIIYGDFSAYRIVDRLAMSILVDPYTLAKKNMTRIHANRRVGGKVIQAARFRKLKMATS
ncbi:peptidase U35 [Devosia pacifica]|uniref:Peptidase U35 n=1 Tax=Devosia pacifica TaxID=1335967 RepID=A0A918RSR0_9HYPH|nr:phage major capsid protein [Devosia pacifica]GHA11327.1 peptidase U35 [Devosia pacifica]